MEEDDYSFAEIGLFVFGVLFFGLSNVSTFDGHCLIFEVCFLIVNFQSWIFDSRFAILDVVFCVL